MNNPIINPHQQLIQRLDLMLRARYPLLYIVGVEEGPIEQVLQQLTQLSQTPRQLLLWDIVTGWDDNGNDKNSVMGALARIAKAPENTTTIFVLRDIHFILKNPDTEKNAPVIRAIKNLTRQLKRTRQTLILTSHILTAFGSLVNGNRRDFTTEDILLAISETVPLAAIAKEQIANLKRWAAEAGARTASIDMQLMEELKTYSQQQGLGFLEVD
ncbi:hypothetical protein [Anabaenopsis elenkinii]|uniref:AAA+ ATPase domain-containing protein n=1 Tax=Anabaenopsis elenkinii CCIBt3563 TaxID=2779889 RepID=A0A7S6RBX7_9CYAN|nr:hypothetical protein [Anabaenopsis elenkinii]QOV22114.1 hypothetical protein IM676_15670 [Anabaenopsis elenkinii CCIBt3563]